MPCIEHRSQNEQGQDYLHETSFAHMTSKATEARFAGVGSGWGVL